MQTISHPLDRVNQQELRTITVLTLRQPWVWAIFHSNKTIENRTWATRFRGELYIHAGNQYDKSAQGWIETHLGIIVPGPKHVPRGVVYGKVQVTGCELCVPKNWPGKKWAMPEHFHWLLESPEVLANPFPRKGQLGLFQQLVDPKKLEFQDAAQ
ncbi:MAG: ASCH domain-containing protein [Chroococcales cyanobacterium]